MGDRLGIPGVVGILLFFCITKLHFCPAANGRGAFDIVRENVTRSVCLSVSLSLSLSLSLCLSIPRAAKREFGTD